MDWGYFLKTLCNALSEGSVYALIAVGYTMVYGIIKLINFAHGEVYMIGAMTSVWLFVGHQLPLVVVVPLCMLICAALGLFLDTVAYKPLRGSTRLAALITAIGMSLILQGIVQLITPNFHALPVDTTATVLGQDKVEALAEPRAGAEVVAKLRPDQTRPITEAGDGAFVGVSWRLKPGTDPVTVWLPREAVRIERGLPEVLDRSVVGEVEFSAPSEDDPAGVSVFRLPFKDVLTWITALAMMGGLHLLVQRTKIGKAMRACALDQTTAALMGVNVNRVIAFTFMVGSAMAAVAGILYSIKVGGGIYFRMGYYPGVIAFAAAVLGGIGHLKGALLGAMLLGFASSFWQGYANWGFHSLVPSSTTKDFSPYSFAFCFLVMIVVIVFRPYGLLGRAGADRA
ncbi:MAG: branched-chain amino acid ABC transporter permease [Planctomycetota bacterium]